MDINFNSLHITITMFSKNPNPNSLLIKLLSYLDDDDFLNFKTEFLPLITNSFSFLIYIEQKSG
jgi:hypothetical protein